MMNYKLSLKLMVLVYSLGAILYLMISMNSTTNLPNFTHSISDKPLYDIEVYINNNSLCAGSIKFKRNQTKPKKFIENLKEPKAEILSSDKTPPGIGEVLIYNNFVTADLDISGNESITLCTQSTDRYIVHVIELCKRWQGPISISIFAPGKELNSSLEVIKYLRTCSKEAECIRNFVNWHLIYPKKFGPEFLTRYQESGLTCNSNVLNLTRNHRQELKIPYPINLCRNVARKNAKTFYVLVSDIELYPSEGIIDKFLSSVKVPGRTVYPLPIFEVTKSTNVPWTKNELISLFKEKKAIFFHKFVCPACQFVPKRQKWINTKDKGFEKCYSYLTIDKRRGAFKHWEPVYIGTKYEPEYLTLLSWEGKVDKMSQAYEMCLMDYNFALLDDSFLCHSPGIKKIDYKDHNRRLKYVSQNQIRSRKKVAQINLGYDSELIKSCK